MLRRPRTSFFWMVFSEECACSISRLTLSGNVSESTRPTSQRRYLRSINRCLNRCLKVSNQTFKQRVCLVPRIALPCKPRTCSYWSETSQQWGALL